MGPVVTKTKLGVASARACQVQIFRGPSGGEGAALEQAAGGAGYRGNSGSDWQSRDTCLAVAFELRGFEPWCRRIWAYSIHSIFEPVSLRRHHTGMQGVAFNTRVSHRHCQNAMRGNSGAVVSQGHPVASRPRPRTPAVPDFYMSVAWRVADLRTSTVAKACSRMRISARVRDPALLRDSPHWEYQLALVGRPCWLRWLCGAQMKGGPALILLHALS